MAIQTTNLLQRTNNLLRTNNPEQTNELLRPVAVTSSFLLQADGTSHILLAGGSGAILVS